MDARQTRINTGIRTGTISEWASILATIEDSCTGDAELQKLGVGMVEAAIRYAHVRTDWALWDETKRIQKDRERSAAHDAFIDACNVLSRTMRSRGKNNAWREQLGQDRKALGDFACFIHVALGLSAR